MLQAWRGGGLAPTTLYLTQHVAIHVALAIMFGLTLRPGQEPLVTALARRVHGGLTPGMAAYSRKVTLVWSVYFVLMASDLDRLCSCSPRSNPGRCSPT